MRKKKKATKKNSTVWKAVHAAPGPNGWAVAAVLPVEGEAGKVGCIDFGKGRVFFTWPAVVRLLLAK
jgi:hypothetical protein